MNTFAKLVGCTIVVVLAFCTAQDDNKDGWGWGGWSANPPANGSTVAAGETQVVSGMAAQQNASDTVNITASSADDSSNVAFLNSTNDMAPEQTIDHYHEGPVITLGTSTVNHTSQDVFIDQYPHMNTSVLATGQNISLYESPDSSGAVSIGGLVMSGWGSITNGTGLVTNQGWGSGSSGWRQPE